MHIPSSLWIAVAGIFLAVGCSLSAGHSLGARDQANLELAELSLARGDFSRALESFEQFLEGNPRHPRGLLGCARANLNLGRGEASLARFDAYREQVAETRDLEQREYCAALAMGAEQAIGSRAHPGRAPELAERLESENCPGARDRVLILLTGLERAELAREQGQAGQALEIYLSLVSDTLAQTPAPNSQRDPGLEREELALVRAYLGAAEILVVDERREEALALLSGGLDKFPNNRDLVHRILTVLADGSSVVFPRVKPHEATRPVTTQ